jgi:hypothetical protein
MFFASKMMFKGQCHEFIFFGYLSRIFFPGLLKNDFREFAIFVNGSMGTDSWQNSLHIVPLNVLSAPMFVTPLPPLYQSDKKSHK